MAAKHRYGLSSGLLIIAGALLAGCSSSPSNPNGGMRTSAINPVNWITPYRVDVIQGNFVSREQVEQLRAGMSRSDVRNTLGTPLLTSVFHADRWDYVFTIKRQGAEPQAYKYAVWFKGDALERFEGDAMPTEAEFIASLDSRRKKLGRVPVLEATEEQLKAAERKPADSASASTAVAPAPAVAPGTYPPLESPKQ